MDSSTISVLSLAIALASVIFGPLVSVYVAKRQLVLPMRQSWLRELQDVLTKIGSLTLHYYVAGFEDRSDSDYHEITLLRTKLELCIDSNKKAHTDLLLTTGKLIHSVEAGNALTPSDMFPSLHREFMALSSGVIKNEYKDLGVFR